MLVESDTGRMLGTVDPGTAPATVHPGAVHLHRGESFVVDTLASIGVTLDPSELAPALVTRYRRSTLYLPEEQRPARATVDVDLTWSSPGGGESLDLPGLAVVETKGSTAPSSLDRALWHLGHRPVRMSKYGTGLSALHDDLPALKWHRTLRRHLAAA